MYFHSPKKTYTGLVKRYLEEKIKDDNRHSRGEQEGTFLLLITEN